MAGQRQARSRYSFAGFTLDVPSERLWRGSGEIKVRRKCFQALRLLVENAGRLVTREELTAHVWPDMVVGEDSLHQCIREVRKALDDSGQAIVKTVPGRGYLFATALEEPSEQVVELPPRSRRWIISAGAVALLVGVATGVAIWRRPQPAAKIPSVAVLPFAGASADFTSDYLSAGVAEGVISSLSRYSDVRVLSFDSVSRLSREKLDLRQSGRRLGAEAIVSGRVSQRGDDVAVSVELVRVSDNVQLWGEQYHSSLAQMVALQDEIASKIGDRLGIHPAENSGSRGHKRYSPTAEAQQEYLKGRYEGNKRTPTSVRAAIAHFQRAVEKDSGFALAWANLALCQVMVSNYEGAPPRQAWSLAKEAALRALKIDDTIGEAHAALGGVQWMADFDWVIAEKELLRAIQLAPHSGLVYQGYSALLLSMGRVQEALAAARRAQELDPLSPLFHSWAANVQFVSGNYGGAMEERSKVLVLDSDWALAPLGIGRIHVQLGRYAEGIAELKTARRSLEGSWRPLGDLAYAYGVAGQSGEARKMLAGMTEQAARGAFPALPIALAYTGLGERDRALEWLRKAVEERNNELWLKTDPRFASLRPDPRFSELLRMMKLHP
jgi:TolB-like protein/DNA-binding winged helix-turn-helix (wHTH) protein/tetratricopeptide (TPR) repeat protein